MAGAAERARRPAPGDPLVGDALRGGGPARRRGARHLPRGRAGAEPRTHGDRAPGPVVRPPGSGALDRREHADDAHGRGVRGGCLALGRGADDHPGAGARRARLRRHGARSPWPPWSAPSRSRQRSQPRPAPSGHRRLVVATFMLFAGITIMAGALGTVLRQATDITSTCARSGRRAPRPRPSAWSSRRRSARMTIKLHDVIARDMSLIARADQLRAAAAGLALRRGRTRLSPGSPRRAADTLFPDAAAARSAAHRPRPVRAQTDTLE